MQTVVVGSGLSSLTAACYLAQAGHRVTLFEQGPTIGGVAATLRRDGYGWDLGPLKVEGLGPGEAVHRVLTELGLADGLCRAGGTIHTGVAVQSIRIPTLIVHSREDQGATFAHALYAQENIEGAELFVAPVWGHFLWIGPGSQQVNERVVAFLREGAR